MGTSDNKITDLVDMVKSWIPRRNEPPNVSRDFWMPDQSCRVCYECDSQFTIFNRKHHCRLCGRVFCAKCTMNSIPAPSDDGSTVWEDRERIRVCNYCFKQWEPSVGTLDNRSHLSTPRISPSTSTTSLGSLSSSICLSSSSTVGSISFSTGPYQNISYDSSLSSFKSSEMNPVTGSANMTSESRAHFSEVVQHSSPNHCHFCLNRSDDEDDEDSAYHFDTDISHYSHVNDIYDAVNLPEIHHVYGPHEMPPDSDSMQTKTSSCSTSPTQRFDADGVYGLQELGKEIEEHDQGVGCKSSACNVESENVELVDFDNNAILWLPPEPEEDEREARLFDDDDDDDDNEGTTGEWGYLSPSTSFGSGDYRNREKSSEEHEKAMKNVVDGHFRALVSQLLQVENLPIGDENGKEGWLEIITSLSWEAATLLKPDTSKSAGMDPAGYVKVKCIACGHCSESMVVKGVVCKKNVVHRRMASRIEKPSFLILGGALEYQRVSNALSSFDTLLQQEMDHLKMAVAKINARHPNVLLVEKSVSRHAQDYLLAKDISLVLNIKRPLLERIARCTGAQIVLSIDHLSSQTLGYCDTFHVEKFFEECGSAGQGGRKLTKNLMFFEGCPKPLGCTILLKGASGDELKKVKHVVQYGIFAAYHLAMETSFLADEGASFPELPLTSPLTVALPNKASNIDRSISTIPGFSVLSSGEFPGEGLENYRTSSMITESRMASDKTSKSELPSSEEKANPVQDFSYQKSNDFLPGISFEEKDGKGPVDSLHCKRDGSREMVEDNFHFAPCDYSKPFGQSVHANSGNMTVLGTDDGGNRESRMSKQDVSCHNEFTRSSKEEFSSSPSDQQSILVFLSTRCVWSGTVCEASHLVRIKYYGSSDKPLGRFLRDQLFDQKYHCHSCEKPSEAHVHCYTHREGSLTISVKKLSETLLPGEREGKIWMWHRCLKCPRVNGFPPATCRVAMSDAAWGLSFGKFLELSFSNHAAASRVASCGHSLHRDCLRFYGFGKMVACFQYASIDLHSVYLPPAKLEFNYDEQEWMRTEANEVQNMAESLFHEVYNAVNKIAAKISDQLVQGNIKEDEFMCPLVELRGMLQKERVEFKEILQKALHRELKPGQNAVDVLELYKLRRLIMFHSYVWDQRLIHAANIIRSLLGDLRSSLLTFKEQQIDSSGRLTESNASVKPGNSYSNCGGLNLEALDKAILNMEGIRPGEVLQGQNKNVESKNEKIELCIASGPDVLQGGRTIRRALSEGEYSGNLSDTLDAAWTGESHVSNIPIKENGYSLPEKIAMVPSVGSQLVTSKSLSENCTIDKGGRADATSSGSMGLDTKLAPFSNFYSSFNRIFPQISPKLAEYIPVYVTLIRDLDRQTGARLLYYSGVSDTVVPVYDDEPTSIVAHALVSMEYHMQMSESERDASVSLPLLDSTNLLSFNSFDETITDACRSLTEESVVSTSGSRNSQNSQVMDPLTFTNDLHARVSFTDESSLRKVKYNVTCYYARRFEALRRICCSSEMDFIRSLSRCKKWGAQGGKSNVFFAKTLDDRFVVKQVTKTELESFIKFAPAYFKYLSESISTGSPTCLAKILGIYQVSSKYLKGGKETKMDILVMENLLFRRNVTRLYDLKGCSRSRYNPDTSGSNKVLLDQNLIESMPTSPIFIGNKPKRLLGRAVWNDSGFLASVHVMDYSLLVGVDEQKHELVLGIIDFMRQYTWDKHLETWVKKSGILGGPNNASPTVISPEQYKKRFRKAMGAYFLMVPEWSSPASQPSGSLSDVGDEKKS